MNRIGNKELFSIALGSVIGWGAFVLPGTYFLTKAGVINTLIGFCIAIVMIAVIEKNYSLLMQKYRTLGGEYTFAKQELGDRVGFFTGWVLLLAYISIIPLNATAVPMVFERIVPFYSRGALLYSIVDYPVYLNDLLVSLFFIALFSFAQIKGLKYSSRMQNFTVLLLLVCVFIIFFATLGVAKDEHKSNFISNTTSVDLNAILRVVAFAPWAFIGFDTVAQIASKSRVNSKSASLMALVAVVFGGFVYNAINIVTGFGIPNDQLSSDSWATGTAVLNLLGPFALMIMGLAMFGAVLSGLNGFFMGSTHLTSAMLQDRSENQIDFKKIIIFVTLVSLVVPFFGRNALFWFVDVSSVGASFAYLATSVAAIKISKNQAQLVFSIVGALFSLMFLCFLLTPIFGTNIPKVSFYVLAVWVLLGFLLYFISYSKHSGIMKMERI